MSAVTAGNQALSGRDEAGAWGCGTPSSDDRFMERYRLYRKVASLQLVGVMLLPLACNMPAPTRATRRMEAKT